MTLSFSRAQILLFAVCGLLVIALAYELFAPLRDYDPPTAAVPATASSAPVIATYTPPAFSTYAIIAERSVFNPLRTPIVEDSSGAAAGAGDALPSDLALVGVILDGAVKMAMLKSSQSPLVVSVPQGAVFEGWQVATVEPDRVVFAAHGARQEIKLSDNKPPPPAADDAAAQHKPPGSDQ
jgi:hypothetical protein